LGQRSRKRRRSASSERPPAPAAPPAPDAPPDDFAARYRARGAARDAEARARLEPLAPGERPRAVTIAAIVAAVSAIANLGLALAGVEVRGSEPSLAGQAVMSSLLLAAAWGAWRARYWAVLGIQTMTALTILVVALFVMLRATLVEGLLLVAIVLAPLGALFWALVKAMARIQMPERP
jgi:hypothetical protein